MEELFCVKQVSRLPTPFPVLQRIGAVVEAADASSIAGVVEALKLDPVIAAKALRLANSISIGIPRKISSIRNAVSFLGLERVRSLVLAARLTGQSGDAVPPTFPLDAYWRHSVATAGIAESIGRHLKRYDHVDEHELYSAAILHDIGKLACAVIDPERLAFALARSRRESLPFYKAEDAGETHEAAGGSLARSWGFPPDLAAAISGHHDPFAQGAYSRFVAVVHVADVMAHILGFSTFEKEAAPGIDGRALEAVRLPAERLRIIAETEVEHQRRVEDACEMFQTAGVTAPADFYRHPVI